MSIQPHAVLIPRPFTDAQCTLSSIPYRRFPPRLPRRPPSGNCVRAPRSDCNRVGRVTGETYRIAEQSARSHDRAVTPARGSVRLRWASEDVKASEHRSPVLPSQLVTASFQTFTSCSRVPARFRQLWLRSNAHCVTAEVLHKLISEDDLLARDARICHHPRGCSLQRGRQHLHLRGWP
jgi:hypothetical protein